MTTRQKILQLITTLVVLAFVVSSCSQDKNEVKNEIQNVNNVVVLSNGNILTMNPAQPNAKAMATKGGKIIAVGDLATVKKAAGKISNMSI